MYHGKQCYEIRGTLENRPMYFGEGREGQFVGSTIDQRIPADSPIDDPGPSTLIPG